MGLKTDIYRSAVGRETEDICAVLPCGDAQSTRCLSSILRSSLRCIMQDENDELCVPNRCEVDPNELVHVLRLQTCSNPSRLISGWLVEEKAHGLRYLCRRPVETRVWRFYIYSDLQVSYAISISFIFPRGISAQNTALALESLGKCSVVASKTNKANPPTAINPYSSYPSFLKSHTSPQTSAIFALSVFPIFLFATKVPATLHTKSIFLFIPFSPPSAPQASKASTNCRGVLQTFCISIALSAVSPRVHMSIFRKTSRRVRESDFEASEEKDEKVT